MTKRRDSLSHTQECFARSTTDPADQEGESLINVVRRVSFSGNYLSLVRMPSKPQFMWDHQSSNLNSSCSRKHQIAKDVNVQA